MPLFSVATIIMTPTTCVCSEATVSCLLPGSGKSLIHRILSSRNEKRCTFTPSQCRYTHSGSDVGQKALISAVSLFFAGYSGQAQHWSEAIDMESERGTLYVGVSGPVSGCSTFS